MVKRLNLNPDQATAMADLMGKLSAAARAKDTPTAGVKDLGTAGDVTWTRPDGTAGVSIRDVDADLADARGRLSDAEGTIADAAERITDAQETADATKARLDDPSADLAEAIVQAMTTETKFLVVTDEAILNHATLLGETVVDQINVRDKLIGTDGVFTGTVDFANINVTGDVLAANISGEHLYGTVVEGGLIKTTDGLQGQVELADDGYVDADGTKYPGVRITPVDTSGVSVKPAIGPNGYGLKINGGRSSSGASSYAALDFNGAQLNWSKESSSAKAGVFSDQASMNFTGTTGEGQLLASASVVQISQENTAGSAIIQVDKDAAILEKRKGSTGYQLRLEDSGLWYVDGSTSFLINDLWEPTWNNLPIASGWSWPHGRRPAYAVVGNKVLMRGRYGRADGGNFLTSESYSPFDMPPALRPAETTSGLGNVAGFVNAGCCRLEQSSGGTFTFGVSKNTSWIAMDGFSYDLI
ncbi:hypothetical protein [Brachybacterium sp. NPDC056505]|uniref:hypothetical protein n=1 Tax=Brachybacterium sp. NPDC056505 TaxID=3345843 RepID=UPI00366DA264